MFGNKAFLLKHFVSEEMMGGLLLRTDSEILIKKRIILQKPQGGPLYPRH